MSFSSSLWSTANNRLPYLLTTAGTPFAAAQNPQVLAPPKTVSLGTQVGTLNTGVAGSATFAVTTANITAGTSGTITWFTNEAGTGVLMNLPSWMSASLSNVTGNAATVTVNTTASSTAQTYFLRVTIDGVQSNIVRFTISALPALTGTVTLNNTSPRVGDVITATYAGGNGSGAATWSWIRNDILISGATSSTYTVVAADEGARLWARVSYANQSGNVSSAQTAAVTAAPSVPFAGSGTATTPYLISNATELAAMRDLINAGTAPYANANIHYRVTSNITVSDWTPIGTFSPARPFRGNFNGNGQTITVTFTRTAENNGLFGYIENGTVRNLGVVANINGGANTGGIVGTISGGTISACFVSGTVIGSSRVGGIAGHATNTAVIRNSYTSASVTGTMSVGGITGSLLTSSRIAYCYSTSAIRAVEDGGGIAGSVNSNAVVYYSIALNPHIQRVSGSANTFGRVIGFLGGSTVDNASLSDMSLPSGASGNNGSGITVAQAKTQATYSAAPRSWLFGTNEDSPWRWNAFTGYANLPTLWWQAAAPALPTHLN
jgi:hypothetical protein